MAPDSKFETAARQAGWTPIYSAFTRHGVTIAYVSWEVLCREERIDPDSATPHPDTAVSP